MHTVQKGFYIMANILTNTLTNTLKHVLIAASFTSAAAGGASAAPKPTIVLVHGAFADASSWNGEVTQLQQAGYRVIAPPNQLRGIESDAASVAALLKTIDGPIVLVGHSYGGPVIEAAAYGNAHVKALVFVSAYLLDAG